MTEETLKKENEALKLEEKGLIDQIGEDLELCRKTIATQDELLVERKKYEDMLKSHISDLELENDSLRKQVEELEKEFRGLHIISKAEFIQAINETETKEEAMKKLDMGEKEFDLRFELFGLGTRG